MKIFVIGGLVDSDAVDRDLQKEGLSRLMRRLGQELAKAHFAPIVCSLYEESADYEVLSGWVSASQDSTLEDDRPELHYPEVPEIVDALTRSRDDLGLHDAKLFQHPPVRLADGHVQWTNSWLLAQLSAMERSNAVVAIGGKLGGSANLLLQLAASRRVPVLPLGHLGGAAAAFLERHRYEIQDRLGDTLEDLKGPKEPKAFCALIQQLVSSPRAGGRTPGSTPRFFISYSRARQPEADYVEMTLRRRNCVVYRDDHDFELDGDIVSEIKEAIHRADVFLALWCQEYACSPWCNDELEIALDRADADAMTVILLDLDGTRIVPRRARHLIKHAARTRPEIEALLLRLASKSDAA
ncbi:toll/interleukin-1 receptor domain-containing protein [Azospirillum largimobile]